MDKFENTNLPESDQSAKANESNDNSLNTDNKMQKTYGAVYTPGEDGNRYSCAQYCVDMNQQKNEHISDKAKPNTVKPKNKRSGTGRTISVIALAVLLCVIFSSVSAFGVTMLTRGLINSYSDDPEITDEPTTTVDPNTNQVYIDKSDLPSYTVEQVVPGELMSMEQAISTVKDSVVEITTETVKSGFGGFSQYVVSGAGSGVIVSTSGYIITNNHVIDGASNITVRLSDGSEYEATLIGTDSKTDVAVISITPLDGVELTTAVIGSGNSLVLGQTVIAIGNPLGELGGTVTDGIISSLTREISVEGSGTMTLLQTNAAVSPGNSGGGLFDMYGRLVGIVNAKFSGDGVEGISFAIPIDTAWDVAQQLINKGYVSGRPALGITLKQVQYGYSIFGDTYYQVVVADPMKVEGLRVDDVIVSIDDVEVSMLSEISDIVSSHKIGDTVTVTVIRDRRYYQVNITLVEYVPATAEISSGKATPNN